MVWLLLVFIKFVKKPTFEFSKKGLSTSGQLSEVHQNLDMNAHKKYT